MKERHPRITSTEYMRFSERHDRISVYRQNYRRGHRWAIDCCQDGSLRRIGTTRTHSEAIRLAAEWAQEGR